MVADCISRVCSTGPAQEKGEAQGVQLLDELKAHATQDKYCHTYDYANGDVILWDNALLLHSAPLIDLTRPRELWRVTVKYS